MDEGDVPVDQGPMSVSTCLWAMMYAGHRRLRRLSLLSRSRAMNMLVGELGGGDLLLIDQAVPQIGSPVRGDDADVPGGVPRQL